MDFFQDKAGQDTVLFLSSSGEGCHLGKEGLLGTSRVAHHSEVPDTINKAVFVRAIWGGPLLVYPGRATLVPLWGDLTPATRKVSRLTYVKRPEEKKPRRAKGQVEQRVKKPAASSSRLCR